MRNRLGSDESISQPFSRSRLDSVLACEADNLTSLVLQAHSAVQVTFLAATRVESCVRVRTCDHSRRRGQKHAASSPHSHEFLKPLGAPNSNDIRGIPTTPHCSHTRITSEASFSVELTQLLVNPWEYPSRPHFSGHWLKARRRPARHLGSAPALLPMPNRSRTLDPLCPTSHPIMP